MSVVAGMVSQGMKRKQANEFVARNPALVLQDCEANMREGGFIAGWTSDRSIVAEREGFEPSIGY